MTIKGLMLKEVGREGYRKLPADMKALIRKIDRLPDLSVRAKNRRRPPEGRRCATTCWTRLNG